MYVVIKTSKTNLLWFLREKKITLTKIERVVRGGIYILAKPIEKWACSNRARLITNIANAKVETP